MKFTSVKFTLKLKLYVFSGLFIIISSGCGRVETGTFTQQAYPISTPTFTPSPSPLEATKAAQDARIESELATAEAQPRPAYPPPLATDTPGPLPTIESGVLISCDTLYDMLIDETNCWREVTDNTLTFVIVGSEPANLQQGKLILFTTNLTTYEASPVSEYTTPSQAGAITITSVNLPFINVSSTGGANYVFNLETLSWNTAYP